MEAKVRESKSGYVLELSGRLDLRVAPELKEKISEGLDSSNSRIVLDLLRVDFIDSAALGIFVGAHRDAQQQDGKLVLVAPEGPANQIFTLTKTDQFFNILPSVEEALETASA